MEAMEAQIEEAFRRYGRLVHVRCRAILRDEAAAEDVLQETFVRLWRYRDSWEASESKLGWLYRTAQRCCFDVLAKRKAQATAPILGDALGSTPSAAQAFEDRDLVFSFLARFDDKLREVAILHYLDEMTQDEIAAATGWSRQTVNKKIQFLSERATALRRIYAEGNAA
jgi:RNA polymerase sigma-70 factor (ECF subfamily)